ncbi:MAG TPA: biotin/lipoate A/B protein ligase family protein [Patescibacteria group bacterium]|nr:biotin/lipoate A/B protein ligase family protein [Patescibacteria group bacterium]
MPWRLIDSGVADAVTNMAVDEALLLSQQQDGTPPTLRLYGWRPAAVSLGYFQKAAKEIDLDACRERGIDVVRRLTGGRAVLHDAELTYSITIREDHPLVPPTITASYLMFSNGLAAALRELGAEVQMSLPRAAYGQSGVKSSGSAACFDAPSHYEITAAGRKLVGSAQVRKDGVLLQHGSILLTFDPEMVAATMKLADREAKSRLAGILARKAISLGEHLNRTVTAAEVAAAIGRAFGPALGVGLVPGCLTPGEATDSRRLAAEKYSQDAWNQLR